MRGLIAGATLAP